VRLAAVVPEEQNKKIVEPLKERLNILYLHIGGPKTGSSWLQNSFLLSREKLTSEAIIYPFSDRALAKSIKGNEITSESEIKFIKDSESFNQYMNCIKRGGTEVYSSERVFE
jgi:hypothetical protein